MARPTAGRWTPEQWRVLVAALSGVSISLFPVLMVIARRGRGDRPAVELP